MAWERNSYAIPHEHGYKYFVWEWLAGDGSSYAEEKLQDVNVRDVKKKGGKPYILCAGTKWQRL
ncbi:MAG: hypothetical protein HXS41_04875 [Theionarchaea archaeon]|nr:hypothetical protein [Theionarchaea archaeon]MBU6999628.1 hypothetical protein [Theionarchaea archaeon]MBU7020368.1 hypothetical protein [Theionarchaea archaeon]